MNIERNLSTDILIVGGGLAALKAMFETSKSGLNVTIAVKSHLCSGSSFYPLTSGLGCQAPRDEKDKELFLEEINKSSFGMNDEELSRIYIEEIRDRVKELPEMGIEYKKLGGGRVACFAERARDIFIWKDWSKIRNNVYKHIHSRNNIKLLEHTQVIKLVKKGHRICGAIAIDSGNNIIVINTKAVIIATGGFGALYKHSLNSEDVSGDGHILALDAGAKLTNMEFIQFIPGLIKPKYKALFSESTLYYCNKLVNTEGNNILIKYLPNDISEKECFNQRAKHGPFTFSDCSRYFDIAMFNEIKDKGPEYGCRPVYDKKILEDKREFIQIYVNWLKDKLGINIVEDDIYIAPFAHASNGGIIIDKYGSTGVEGLFAAGEVAGTMHGADRHGGNASGNCLVFGKRAADSAIRHVKCVDSYSLNNKEVAEELINRFDTNINNPISPRMVIEKIKDIMWYNGNVVRTEHDLKKAIEQVKELKEEYNGFNYLKIPELRKQAVTAANFIELSEVLLKVMLERKESRGSHYREDYPHINDSQYGKRIQVTKGDKESIVLEYI